MDRLHIVGPFPHAAYLSLNLACDVFLDAHGWSGGNTTLEALNLDLPIVTTPGKYMRGRHSAAILKQLGLEDSIADSVDSWVQKRALTQTTLHYVKRVPQISKLRQQGLS